jgi:hypothetical protein
LNRQINDIPKLGGLYQERDCDRAEARGNVGNF